MNSKLNSLERAVLDKLLFGDLPLLAQLRSQLEKCGVEHREFTGYGFYVTLSVPDYVPRVEATDFKLGDVFGKAEGTPSEVGFLLYIKDGILDLLEAYSYDEPWSPTATKFKLKYDNGEDRDWKSIEKIVNV